MTNVPKTPHPFTAGRILFRSQSKGALMLNVHESGHHIVFGSSGKGRSLLLQAEAAELGISYEELERRLEPTDEQKAAVKAREDAREQLEEARMAAVREAYWSNSKGLDDLDVLAGAIASFFKDKDPATQLQKALFDLLPDHVIGSGISWGFDDTEVQDAIWNFVHDEAAALAEKLGLPRPAEDPSEPDRSTP